MVVVQLAVGALRDPIGVVTAIVAFALLVRGVGTGWLVAGGAAIGLVRMAIIGG